MALQSGRPFSGETLLLPRVTQSLCARFTVTRFYFYYFRLCRVISNEQLLVQAKRRKSIVDGDGDCFYVALFSALEQTHCARM